MSDKEMAAAALDKMPDTATLDEIREELAILAGIRRRKADAASGGTVSYEETKQCSAVDRKPGRFAGLTAFAVDLPNSPTDLSVQHDHYLYGTPKR